MTAITRPQIIMFQATSAKWDNVVPHFRYKLSTYRPEVKFWGLFNFRLHKSSSKTTNPAGGIRKHKIPTISRSNWICISKSRKVKSQYFCESFNKTFTSRSCLCSQPLKKNTRLVDSRMLTRRRKSAWYALKVSCCRHLGTASKTFRFMWSGANYSLENYALILISDWQRG